MTIKGEPHNSNQLPDGRDGGDLGRIDGSGANYRRASPDEIQARIIEILYNKILTEDPLDRKDSRTGAHLPELIRSYRGVEQLRSAISDLLVFSFDGNKWSIANDVGLSPVVDFILERIGQIYKEGFSKEDKLIRIAGDEMAFLTTNDEVGSKKVDNALAQISDLVDSALKGKVDGEDYFFGLPSREVFNQRVFEATRLACFSKTLSMLSSLYRMSERDSKTSIDFGNWLTGKIGPTLLNEWVQSRKLAEFTDFDSFDPKLKRDPEYLAHDLQAFVALRLTSNLLRDESFKYDDADDSIINMARNVCEEAKLFGVTGAKVSVENPGRYSPVDIKTALVTAEKIIQKGKLSKESDASKIHATERNAIQRQIDILEIEESDTRVERLYSIKSLIDSSISEEEKLLRKREAFSLLCADASCPDAFRLDRIKDLQLKLLMNLSKDKFCTSMRFSLPGFGVLNKHLRMDLADNVFTGLMDRFKKEVELMAVEAGMEAVFIREGGGKGTVIFSGHLKINAAKRADLATKLSQNINSLITEPIKMAFYEREAFRTVASRSTEFPNYRMSDYKRRGICDVQIEVEERGLIGNLRVAEAYKLFWPK